eukprot:TRINITY_DN2670_c7_g1_i1.p1 TRINITY_DN2670_c7_g1~~TRINITY_DN2670_c7_g1_i1.p1  ORF type:complete len:488 (+),score=93.55 TRINITY_DN2670_c7_g1_i1:30-1466(+)
MFRRIRLCHQAADIMQKPEVMVQDKMKVGWVGLGNMGMGMSWKIIKEPTNTVHLWTRSERKLEGYCKYMEEQMNRWVFQRPLLIDIPRFADIIFVSLANIRATREVLLERDDAILYNAKPGTVIVNHSTVDPETCEELAQVAAARDLLYLDAPVAGSPELSQTGNLTVMVGGDEMGYRKAAKLMSRYASTIQYMGPAGAGTRTKILVEAVGAAQNVLSAECALLAKSLGLNDFDQLSNVVDSTLSGSNMLRRNLPYMAHQFQASDKVFTGTTISRQVKNLRIMERAIPQNLNEMLPLISRSKDIALATGEAGGHDADISSVLHFLNPANPNTEINWKTTLQTEESESTERDTNTAKFNWHDVTELEAPQNEGPSSSADVPTISKEKLESLFSKARPTAAASVSGQGRAKVVRSAFEAMSNPVGEQHHSVKSTMDKFANVGKIFDRSMGKATFHGVPFHQRAQTLVDPTKGRTLDANGP